MPAAPSRSRPSAARRWLLALPLLACATPAAAQGVSPGLAALPERTFASAIAGRCRAAYLKITDTTGAYFPRERLAAIDQYRWCLAAERTAPPAREAGLELPAGATGDATARTELQLLDGAVPSLQAGESFLGFTFGVAVGASMSASDVIPEAQVGPAGTVVAVKRARTLPRVMLESHYYGWCSSSACKAGRFGWGPYLGVVTKSDKLISAFSVGLMMGWRNPSTPDSAGFSLGMGAILDDAVTSLAPGFKVGQPRPAGETAIRYEEKARWGLLIFGSRTF